MGVVYIMKIDNVGLEQPLLNQSPRSGPLHAKESGHLCKVKVLAVLKNIASRVEPFVSSSANYRDNLTAVNMKGLRPLTLQQDKSLSQATNKLGRARGFLDIVSLMKSTPFLNIVAPLLYVVGQAMSVSASKEVNQAYQDILNSGSNDGALASTESSPRSERS